PTAGIDDSLGACPRSSRPPAWIRPRSSTSSRSLPRRNRPLRNRGPRRGTPLRFRCPPGPGPNPPETPIRSQTGPTRSQRTDRTTHQIHRELEGGDAGPGEPGTPRWRLLCCATESDETWFSLLSLTYHGGSSLHFPAPRTTGDL